LSYQPENAQLHGNCDDLGRARRTAVAMTVPNETPARPTSVCSRGAVVSTG
jgi:hypothetical protein